MKKSFILAIFTLFSSFLFIQATEFSFRCLPYLQHLTPNAVTVFSVASAPCVSYVQFGETPEMRQSIFASQHGQIEANVPVQKIRLENLKAGQTYYYRVISKEIKVYQAYKVQYGDSVVSPIGSFRTPSSSLTKFSFLAFNDVHSRPAFIDTVFQKNKDVDFICYNGDMLDDINSRDEIIQDFCAPAARFFAGSIPFVYTRGNHETRGSASRELSNFVEAPEGRFYYSFKWGNSVFMVLNMGEDKPDTHPVYAGLADYDRYRSEQAEWVKKVTTSTDWKKAKHRIVCAHIPASTSNDGWHGSVDVATKFLPLLNNARVDLYLCGHTHEPVLERPGANHNFTMVVGGGPMRGDKPNATYIRVDVDNKQLSVKLSKYDGEIIDEYRVK